MLLVIDAGNTNTVFAVYDGDQVRGQWRLATDGGRTADEYAVWFAQLLTLQGIAFADIDDAIIATVVPETLFNLRQLCTKHLNFEALLLGAPTTDLGIEVRVAEPASVGADRVANAVGAHLKYSGDLIVVDFGTATTFDVVAADGAYEGGVIAPGVNLSVHALHKAAARLPHVAIEKPTSVIGTDTITAMKSGVFWGYISLIEGLIDRIKAERSNPMTVIATGGLSRLFRHGTDSLDHVDEDITIEGLREIHRRNRSAS